MKKMMFENGGCGLAAPQIGELIQLVTIDCDYSDKKRLRPVRAHQSRDCGAERPSGAV